MQGDKVMEECIVAANNLLAWMLLDFPNPEHLPGYDQTNIFPYVFVADEAFGLKPHMMRPYPRRNEPSES